MRFSIIGAGNLGVNLIYYLNNSDKYNLKYVYKKSKYDLFEDKLCDNIEGLIDESDIIFISTQESGIKDVVKEIVKTKKRINNKYVFHTSNSLGSDELMELKNNGFFIGAFSPVQTFSTFYKVNPFNGVFFLYEGDKEGENLSKSIANELNAEVKFVGKEEKLFYHIAAIGSSNFVISVLKFARRVYGKEDYERIFFPLLKKTIDNILEKGIDESLTGPAKRGEKELIQRHKELLKDIDREIYDLLTKNLTI